MSAIDDRFYAVPPRHLTDCFDRSDLSRQVDLMRDLKQTRTRRDGALKCGSDIVDVLWRNRNLDQVELNTFALLALAYRRQHASIVLSGRQHLVAGFQIQ